MSIKSELVGALIELERDMGNPVFIWKGVEVPCIPGDLSRGAVLQIGGIMVEVHLMLIVRKALWVSADDTIVTADDEVFTADNNAPTPIPVARKFLIYEDVQYKIERAVTASVKSHINLYLTDPNR